jgi:hypothetical protein
MRYAQHRWGTVQSPFGCVYVVQHAPTEQTRLADELTAVLRLRQILQLISGHKEMCIQTEDCRGPLIASVEALLLDAKLVKLPEGNRVTSRHQQRNSHEAQNQAFTDPESNGKKDTGGQLPDNA